MAKIRLRFPSWSFTHLLAFGIGWAVWSGMSAGEVAEKSSIEAKLAAERIGERRRMRVQSLSGDRILTEIAGPKTEKSIGPSKEGRMAEATAEAMALSKKADELEPAADVGAAVRDLFAKLSEDMKAGKGSDLHGEIAVRALHWMRVDPMAAIAFLTGAKIGGADYGSMFLMQASAATIVEIGPSEAAKFLGVNGRFDEPFKDQIADISGFKGDLTEMMKLKANMTISGWGDLRYKLARSWPMEKAADLIALTQAENSPGLLANFALKNGAKGAEWLQQQIAAGTLDPRFQAELMQKGEYKQMMLNNPTIDFETRVSVVAGFDPNRSLDEIRLTVGANDVTAVLNKGRDWRYAFRNGTASADEIYQAIAAEMPNVAAKNPEVLKNQLYKELAEEDGPRALELLDHLSGDAKWQAALKTTRYMYFGVNPQEMYDLMQKIPTDAGEAVWNDRVASWGVHANENSQRFGAEYAKWVMNLPEGMDREMAALALAKNGTGLGPEIVENLKTLIKDPKIRERLKK